MSRSRLRGAAALGLALALGVAAPASGQLGQAVERSRPVPLGEGADRVVQVAATYEELADAPAGGWRRTLTRLAFSDQRGRLLYQETFASRLAVGRGFEEELTAAAPLELRGTRRSFLLLGLHVAHSAPPAGTVFLVYGFDRAGRFRRLGGPLEGAGPVLRNPVTAGVMHLREGRYLDVGRWTGNFTLVLPHEFREEQEAFLAAGLCGPVEVDRQPPPRGTVLLHRGPGPRFPTISVPVTGRSTIRFLAGCRGQSPSKPDEHTDWIHVRVDGEEGWVPTEQAPGLGLPDAG